MLLITQYVILSLLGSVLVAFMKGSSSWQPLPMKRFNPWELLLCKFRQYHNASNKTNEGEVKDIMGLAKDHETAARLADLVQKDGAGSWPPRANHEHSTWPAALRPYREIYEEMAPLLPAANVSLDDEVNEERITFFRSTFRKLLNERVNLQEVTELFEAAEAGRWEVFPRDAYNAFYCCIAWCRHAYRWGTIPVVRVAQLEKIVTLPPELVSPWASIQQNFGLFSDSGNMMSNLVLNFSPTGEYSFKINTGLPPVVNISEEEFARIPHEMEGFAMPIYHNIVKAIISFTGGDKAACLEHVQEITSQLRPLLSSYYDRVHDAKIARSVWLSRVQGFHAWGAGYQNKTTGEWEKFDGLSGNQVLLFQVLDSFLGLEAYLPMEVQEMNVPKLQREFCAAVGRHAFRHMLGEEGVEGQIRGEIVEIVKRLRLFRSAHRTRSKFYLTQPAPERLPMTAGKSLLKEDMDQSMQFLDEFMLGRLQQTV